MSERIILHSDLNNYYASVECLLNPSLRGKAVAVCGNQEERHGIVLAKNQQAKAYGVQTGEAIWQAQKKCKDLVIVPPQYDQYLKFSSFVKEIYYRYTDLIEPFGLDECWLDVSGSQSLFGDGLTIATNIKETIKKELGLTVSIGVSFNKIFAKLGSDMRKPDAITCIPKKTFQEQIWHLPANSLLGIGSATKRKLASRLIYTLGDLAKSDPYMLKIILGVNGVTLWQYANGLDSSRVKPFHHIVPAKSIGHGITCTQDLLNNVEVSQVISELAQGISKRLRKSNLSATGIQISIRDSTLFTKEYQISLDYCTQSFREISSESMNLVKEKYEWRLPIRSISIRAIHLIPTPLYQQLSLFCDHKKRDAILKLEETVEVIRQRYGKNSIKLALGMKGLKIPANHNMELTCMPSYMYR
jgi:DNA polymerase IV